MRNRIAVLLQLRFWRHFPTGPRWPPPTSFKRHRFNPRKFASSAKLLGLVTVPLKSLKESCSRGHRLENFLRYPGYSIGKLTSWAFWKCGGFCCYHFFNRSYGCSKSGENWRIFAVESRCLKKLTLSSYWKLRLETNRIGPQSYLVIFVSSLNLQYDESVFFKQCLFLLLLKFQTPLTLSSHNSGSIYY